MLRNLRLVQLQKTFRVSHTRLCQKPSTCWTPSRRYGTTAPSFSIFSPTPEHQSIRQMVRNFVEAEVDPQAHQANKEEKFNIALFRKLGTLGLHGIIVEEKYGGAELDATAAVIAHEEISASDPAFCLSYLAHSMLFVNNLYTNGSEEQKMKYLPKACSGEIIGGMCMSEVGAGTDVLGMKTKAKLDKDGYILNGDKMWITNGAISESELGDVFLVYAKTGAKNTEVSLFLVEKGTPGFKLGQKIKDKCGMRASATAELVFEDCFVSTANLIGNENDAIAHMMRNLEIERLALAAMSLGIARRCLEIMNSYAKQRKAFGVPINQHGQIQRLIGESYAQYMAGRCYVYNTALNLDLKKSGNRIDSDGVKLFCSTMAKQVADNAIQVLGGNGYIGEYQVERLWRDAKLLEIGGGTLEAHHKNMTRDLSRVDKFP